MKYAWYYWPLLAEGHLSRAFYIPTLVVPPLLVAHIMSFWLLLTKDPSK